MGALSGRVWVLGDNIDTDLILPGKYLASNDKEYLGKHCLEGIELNWPAKVTPGDWIVAGRNFGCGSSREHAVISIRECGIAGLIAESFGSIFFRNAINLGLPTFEMHDSRKCFEDGDEVEVNLVSGEIYNKTEKIKYSFIPMPPIVLNILRCGGLLPYIKYYYSNG